MCACTCIFLISNFHHILYVVCFLLGNSPASEFYMPTFQNTLPVPSSQASRCIIGVLYTYLPMKMEQAECSEMSAYKIQTSGNYPEENIQHIIGVLYTYLPMKMEQTECSEMSVHKIQTPGNYPEENIQHTCILPMFL